MPYGTSQVTRGTINSASSGNQTFKAGPGLTEGRFNFTISGTFVATFRLERRFVDGTVWHPCTNNGNAVSFTGPLSEVLIEPEPGTEYRVTVTSYTSGVLEYRLSQ